MKYKYLQSKEEENKENQRTERNIRTSIFNKAKQHKNCGEI